MYFLWQIRQARHAFQEHVTDHARLVAEVIHMNARNAVFSREVTEEILRTFLGNTARFVNYLDTVEPFTPEELTAFAAETQLSGITIFGCRDCTAIAGPPGLFSRISRAYRFLPFRRWKSSGTGKRFSCLGGNHR